MPMTHTVSSTQKAVRSSASSDRSDAYCLLPTAYSPRRGYTLLELIVSVGLFSLVMLVVMGAYLSLISIDRRARATNDLVTNLSFALESMMRNVRTGSNYSCGSGNGTCSQFSFKDSDNQSYTYLLRSDGTIGQCSGVGSCSQTTATQITDPRITITDLDFYVRGVGSSDGIQPQMTASISGTMPTDQGESVEFTIQTGATQRLIDI
ncbi:MAG TPA: type II secretion system protein [Candidatus Paceibacterota bacterium]|nr:type II secretion system protein [Candidatus Paceibacterota bacterium]